MNDSSLRCAALAVACGSVLGAAGCSAEQFEIALSTSSGPTAGEVDTSAGSTTTAADTGPLDSSTGLGNTSGGSDSDGSSTGSRDCVVFSDDSDWWRSEWRRRRRLEIDTSIFQGPITDLPVLLRMGTDTLGPSWSERQGADLRFRGEADFEVLHDIDEADADGTLFTWLSMPEVDPARGTQTVWMYYDNPKAEADPDTAEAVWAGHISVHHLGNDLDDSAGDHHGSSPWPPEICDGKCGARVGAARSFEPELLHEVIFDGEPDYDLGIAPYASNVMEFSISLWMRAASLADYPWGGLISKGDHTWRIHASSFPGDPRLDQRMAFGFDCELDSCEAPLFDPQNNANLVALTPVDDNQWHHVAVTLEMVGEPKMLPPEYVPDVVARIYIDGVEATEPYQMSEFLVAEDDQPVRLGHNFNNARRWEGDMDEVRVEARPRTAIEIAADYATVVNDHITVGEEQILCR